MLLFPTLSFEYSNTVESIYPVKGTFDFLLCLDPSHYIHWTAQRQMHMVLVFLKNLK